MTRLTAAALAVTAGVLLGGATAASADLTDATVVGGCPDRAVTQEEYAQLMNYAHPDLPGATTFGEAKAIIGGRGVAVTDPAVRDFDGNMSRTWRQCGKDTRVFLVFHRWLPRQPRNDMVLTTKHAVDW